MELRKEYSRQFYKGFWKSEAVEELPVFELFSFHVGESVVFISFKKYTDTDSIENWSF